MIPSHKKKWVTFNDAVCEKATSNACLCEIDGADHWIPKSQIHEDSEVYEQGTCGDLIISEWIAKQKSLI